VSTRQEKLKMLFKKVMIIELSRTNTKMQRLLKKQRDVNQEYCDDKSFEDIETTKVLFEKALK